MRKHLSDDRLIELGMSDLGATGFGAAGPDPHLAGCAECQSRYTGLVRLLDEVTTMAVSEADATFPADRLARQQARILQRIEQDGRPGRLITFPASHPHAPLLVRSRPASRWVAAAAVAGMVVGLLTGQMLPVGISAPASQIVSNEASSSLTLRAVSTTLSDDEFLGQVEAAGSAGPAALRPLDALTPRAWEVATR
jgi:hypothetical protein